MRRRGFNRRRLMLMSFLDLQDVSKHENCFLSLERSLSGFLTKAFIRQIPLIIKTLHLKNKPSFQISESHVSLLLFH
ncbi:hypothetical protein RIF29_17282 [Crotalaria pallida]|uniref:Uncharacterized protein n=1 Tax=Crotalaria pallida TaxID=3830 RepID=A0AAN9FH02_CROPI